jgi:hypothetical protein
MKPRSISATSAAAIAALIVMAEIHPAQADETVRVRGAIASLEGSTLTVKTREGPDAALALKPEWKVIGVTAASAGDIKPGDFVGIASLPGSGGGDGTIEVLIFPPAMKGTGEGSYPWDLKPKSTMTNGTVMNAVKEVDGRTLTVSYKGGEKKLAGLQVGLCGGTEGDDGNAVRNALSWARTGSTRRCRAEPRS